MKFSFPLKVWKSQCWSGSIILSLAPFITKLKTRYTWRQRVEECVRRKSPTSLQTPHIHLSFNTIFLLSSSVSFLSFLSQLLLSPFQCFFFFVLRFFFRIPLLCSSCILVSEILLLYFSYFFSIDFFFPCLFSFAFSLFSSCQNINKKSKGKILQHKLEIWWQPSVTK